MRVQSEMREEGHPISITKLCGLFGIPRRSFYYKPIERTPRVDEERVRKVQEKIEEFPTYGYRRLALLLGMNKKAVQRILQLKGWQVRKRAKGHRPRAKMMPSRSQYPNQRWAIDMTRVWSAEGGWGTLACVIDTCTREIVGWRLSKSGKAKTAEAALQEGLIYRFGQLKRLGKPIVLRSDNELVFSSKSFAKTVKDYNFTQEFITPYTPEQNGMIERFFRTIKEECIWHHNFKANRIIGDWIDFYNRERKHSALRYKTPAEVFRLAA
ncbi:IS3 family transposase [Nitratifractor salsuginis]|uniref:Integrase catalytic region n=1 Tax=Nitratifractor salsuginis (strain DSM 16511 / JCM 12458 / E9I37-1) TaxID=749222 RepID=E6X300_NITSE|nr:IS3 family transposase [Nitratifractor salsuginis]ADV47283.1 Integrase catalytic region [Nitratifractor salsuginis DSM 16511]